MVILGASAAYFTGAGIFPLGSSSVIHIALMEYQPSSDTATLPFVITDNRPEQGIDNEFNHRVFVFTLVHPVCLNI
jgi:hypothetical protein